jgi:DNA-binding NarL/FixJ family response regulator
MDTKVKIIIVDDHDMFREGVKVLLGKSQKVEFIGEASDGKEFLKLLEKLNPDVVLMDISMPVMDGIEATRQAVLMKPEIKILALSMFGEEEYYYKMIQSGVHGFVMKSAGINELEHAIHEVAKGSAYFSAELLKHVILKMEGKEAQEMPIAFSDQELKIIQFFTKNFSNEEIAQDLSINIEKVEEIRKNLLVKTGTTNTSALILYAIKNKIVSIN